MPDRISLAAIYHQPALAQLLPVTGLTALIHGFVFDGNVYRRRHMDFKRLTILDLSNETVTFVVLVVWAYFYRNVWALVGGAVVGRSSWCLRVICTCPESATSSGGTNRH